MRAPDRLLLVTVGAQWAVTVAVALAASRTGSLFGEIAVANAWIDHGSSVAHGSLAPTGGPLYALLLAPITLLTTRPSTVASIVTVVNVIILAPLATYCLLDVGRRIAGRPFATAAAATWLFAPLVAVPLFVPKFHDTYVDDVLPALYGLTIGPAFLAMALSLAAAMLALRAVAGAPRARLRRWASRCSGNRVPSGQRRDCGGRHLRSRGRSSLAPGRRGARRFGGGPGPDPDLAPESPRGDLVSTGNPTWNGFQSSMANVREFFYSNRLLQWLPVAGAIGMLRVRRPAAALTAVWVAVATVVAVATPTSFEGGRFFVDLVPVWPAYALLVAAIPALVPTLVARLGDRIGGEVDAPGVSRASAESCSASSW